MNRTALLRFLCVSLLWATTLWCPATIGPTYFVVSARFPLQSVNESFVVPLENESDIALARQMILDPWLYARYPTFRVKIDRGADGINRNYALAGAPEWSWHVTGFIWRAEVGWNESSAHAIEGDFDRFPMLQGQYVSFRGYYVTSELGPALALAIRTNATTMTVEWNTLPDPSFRYTLEARDFANQGTWAPVEGANWPLATNRFDLPLPLPKVRVFRVRAQ